MAALKWVLKNPHIDTVIPSIVDNEQLEENIAAMSAPFSAPRPAAGPPAGRDQAALLPDCGHCQGQCSQGLPVADVLRFLMYAEGYGEFAWRVNISGSARGAGPGPLRFVRQVYGGVPQRRTGVRAPA